METKVKPATAHQVAQIVKAGRGWLITRNSATLADTDYLPIAEEIVEALNKLPAYPRLVEALSEAQSKLWDAMGGADDAENKRRADSICKPYISLLRELGEL